MTTDAVAAPSAESLHVSRIPFRGYKHLGGLAAGLTAGLLAAIVPSLSPTVHPMAVGLCALGALSAFFLSLVNRSLLGALVGLNGGILLGLLGHTAVMVFWHDPAQPEPELMPRIANPFLFAAMCPLLGAGPVALTLFFQPDRRRGIVLRLLLATVAGGLAAMAGLVAHGMAHGIMLAFDWLDPDAAGAQPGPLAVGFLVAGWALFRLQVLILMESSSGDQDAPGASAPAHPAPAPAGAAPGADDAP